MSDNALNQRIIISGASGLIGSALTSFLSERGWNVARLVRRSPRAGKSEIQWSPADGVLDTHALDGSDAIIHLGGANVAAGRWTAARKASIRDSRVLSTRLLSDVISAMARPPRVFICASGTGYYGNRGDELLNEESPPGEGFLAEVCRAWESAAEPARQAGVRVVNLRIGVVLSADGGALPKMLPAFRIGLGGVLGGGGQYMSWISMTDLVGMIGFLIDHDDLAGPINAVAPQPVTNREFTRTLGRVLKRPTILPIPAIGVRAILGEMGQALLLEGNRVRPARVESSEFRFQYPDLEGALRAELKLNPDP